MQDTIEEMNKLLAEEASVASPQYRQARDRLNEALQKVMTTELIANVIKLAFYQAYFAGKGDGAREMLKISASPALIESLKQDGVL